MHKLALVVANKNYPSWSMRAWVLLREAGISYEERSLRVGAEGRSPGRSVCAEMHAGFRPLRGAMPMNIRASLPGKGMSPEVRKDIERIVAIWEDCLHRPQGRAAREGPMLFGAFGVADAMYAPVVTRFATYAVALPAAARAYADAVLGLRAMREWADAARRETELVRADEPY